uniref:Uncharacterized protein n=1 Tax=Anguilla anguilla TaxID=7936 RepID=A0A0E9SCQ1_ANGAN
MYTFKGCDIIIGIIAAVKSCFMAKWHIVCSDDF